MSPHYHTTSAGTKLNCLIFLKPDDYLWWPRSTSTQRSIIHHLCLNTASLVHRLSLTVWSFKGQKDCVPCKCVWMNGEGVKSMNRNHMMVRCLTFSNMLFVMHLNDQHKPTHRHTFWTGRQEALTQNVIHHGCHCCPVKPRYRADDVLQDSILCDTLWAWCEVMMLLALSNLRWHHKVLVFLSPH